MDMAWAMAMATGLCNGGVALAGKAAERGHCRPATYAMVVFAVAENLTGSDCKLQVES